MKEYRTDDETETEARRAQAETLRVTIKEQVTTCKSYK